nr:ATP-binding protein [Oceanobacter mangrovi]
MASLGHLAAGIAHEINNPVAVVYSNIATLSEYLTELIELADQFQSIESSITDLNIRQVLAGMRRAIDLDFVRSDAPELVLASQHSLERVRNIVAELKTFAIQEGQAKRSADLFELMQQAVVELKLDHDERIRVDIQMAGIPRVDCIAGQVRLAFRHILDNARDAIVGEGRIEIAAAQIDDQVQVVVKDSGTGMDSEVLSCAINPFFTRKEIGKGTGLGLTVAFNVMVNHGGSLDIASQPGRGTTVTFTLPIVAAVEHY